MQNSSYIVKYILGPIIVGLIVLGGQFLIQPLIAEKSLARQELWRSKFNAYVEAIEIVNQKFLSLSWNVSDTSAHYTLGQSPSDEKVNDAYARLALLADDPHVPHAYLACFGVYPSQKPVTIDHRTNFIALCRKDLGTTSLDLDSQEIFLVFQKKPTEK